DRVSAAYVNYAGKINDAWRYQTGLRFEHSWFNGREEGSDSTFNYSYPSGFSNLQKAFFPALYLSKKISESSEMQVNFSRKLNRPNFFQIMPFVMIMDNQTYRSGNPNLQPEFVNTAEWNYSKTFGRGSWLTSLYGKYTEQPITEITLPANDGTTALLTTFTNGTSSKAAGLENTLKYTLLKGLDATTNVNMFYQKINAAALGNEGWNWMGKLNLDYKFAKSWNVQVSGMYQSPRVLPQGKDRDNYFADFAIRRELGPMASLSLTVSDIFNTKRMGYYTETEYFTQSVQRRRESRYISLGLSMRFGKPDFSLFKKQQQRKPGDNGAQNGGDMGY
ncbi:MAG: TonB-dependent receptor family protein, partial [Saprospiraceae bacterium]|nr:TonB-dependent receptor family protein [Saprospiraceae bacterium]